MHPKTKPLLTNALRLRCPYCGVTPLLRGRFAFAAGCTACDFTFEREIGYSNAASGLVAFPTISLLGFALAGFLLVFVTNLDAVIVVSLTSVAMIAFGAVFFAYSLAIWLWIEHRLHPLDENDRYPAASTTGDPL